MSLNVKLSILILLTSITLLGGGYKLNTTSLNGTALSAANIANAQGADTAYYNPANMAYNDGKNDLEVDMTYIALTPIKYTSDTGTVISSEAKNSFIPTLTYVSQPFWKLRAGFAIVVPAGSSKKWDEQPARFFAKTYSLTAVEFNPTLSMSLTETIAIAAGFRVVYSKAKAEGDSEGLPITPISRSLDGDSIDTGYNLAFSYRPAEWLSLAATYRSKVDLTLEGDASVNIGAYNADTTGSVESLLPAVVALAAAYHFDMHTALEFVYERTFWSANKSLDFEYDDAFVESVLGAPIAKNWNDTNTYRLGLTHTYSDWTVMAGTFYDETPVPESTLSVDTPDSDSYGVSLGGRYLYDDQWSMGLAGLYQVKKDRTVTSPPNINGIDGEFTNSKAYIVTTGLAYRF